MWKGVEVCTVRLNVGFLSELCLNNMVRASAAGFYIPSYFIISKSNFINYTIPFYNTSSILKLYYFIILLKYFFNIFFLLFLFFSSFSLSLSTSSTGLAPASTSSKPIPSKITRSKSQQKFTQIKQAPELNNLNL